MTKSETQLTLREQIRETLLNKKYLQASVDPTLVDELESLFTQALTSLKSEMEALKLPVKKHHPDMHQRDCIAYNQAISECQRVIEEWAGK